MIPRVESRTGAATVVSRWIVDWALASSPQSGLTRSGDITVEAGVPSVCHLPFFLMPADFAVVLGAVSEFIVRESTGNVR